MTLSGPIQKKSSVSEDSLSDQTELEESAMVADPNLEANLNRLREEEKVLLEKQTQLEAGNNDDIAALEHQDLLRLNQLQQRELKKRQAAIAARLARELAAENEAAAALPAPRREGPRRRICTVRVNNLHAATAGAEAIETDV